MGSHQRAPCETVSNRAAVIKVLLDRLPQGECKPTEANGVPRMAAGSGARGRAFFAHVGRLGKRQKRSKYETQIIATVNAVGSALMGDTQTGGQKGVIATRPQTRTET